MEKFEYQAKDSWGKKLKGIVEASDEKQAVKILQGKNLLVISLKPKRESWFSEVRGIFTRVGTADKVNFTRQLATMITAGLRLTEALDILETQSSPKMKKIVGEIRRDVEGGKDLASALEKHSNIFDHVYIALIRAGELSGALEKVLGRLADNLEKQKEFRNKIKGAMIYPIIVISGMILVGAIMIIFVIPKMTVIYEEFQAELPAPTKILIALSKFITLFWWLGGVIVVGMIAGVKVLFKNPHFRKEYDRILFKVPIVGNLRQKTILSEFTRTLGLLVGTGILIIDALQIVRRSLGSVIYERALEEARKEVEKGLPLASALAGTEVFPPILPQMIAVGEETGKLDEVLGRVSTYFEQDADTAVKGLTTAVEPLIMVILGVGVAFLMISVIMPIYNLTSQF